MFGGWIWQPPWLVRRVRGSGQVGSVRVDIQWNQHHLPHKLSFPHAVRAGSVVNRKSTYVWVGFQALCSALWVCLSVRCEYCTVLITVVFQCLRGWRRDFFNFGLGQRIGCSGSLHFQVHLRIGFSKSTACPVGVWAGAALKPQVGLQRPRTVAELSVWQSPSLFRLL